jgi:dTDP-4-amino-4,6-dideoxygalactose transaminase
VCARVLSLPIYPGMPEADIDTVGEAIRRFRA